MYINGTNTLLCYTQYAASFDKMQSEQNKNRVEFGTQSKSTVHLNTIQTNLSNGRRFWQQETPGIIFMKPFKICGTIRSKSILLYLSEKDSLKVFLDAFIHTCRLQIGLRPENL